METTIRLKPKELNDTFIGLIKNLIQTKGITDITINLSNSKPAKSLRKENPKQVRARIEKSIKDIKEGNENFISFSAEEFDRFSKSLTA